MKGANLRHWENDDEHLPLLDLVILVLSVYLLGAMLADTLFKLPHETHVLLHYIDTAICVVFLIDFLVRFFRAPDKLKFMRWGWIDLLSSIPAVDFLRFGRLYRILRVLRILRAFRITHYLVMHLFENKAKGAFTSAAIFAIMLIIFSSIAILQVERTHDGNIKTAEDALWWAYVTITTVGYGDKYPVTTEGRLIAAVLMTAGVGLFGTFTAYVASWFVVTEQKEQKAEEEKCEAIAQAEAAQDDAKNL
ncbi:MAG: ion transporter [Sphingobacteriales bacterium]|nr:MAG: ion transporter [Sphingobacteriales bacterium]